MDHHCPWINGCVGFANQKPFLLFLFYTCLGAIHGGTLMLLCTVHLLHRLARIVPTHDGRVRSRAICCCCCWL